MSSAKVASQLYVRPWAFPQARVLLSDKSSRVELQITDMCKEAYTSTLYTAPAAAAAALQCKPATKTRLRIISIFSDRTIAPLNVTSDLLKLLFSEYDLTPEFADVVASFGEEPNIAEGRSNNARLQIAETGIGDVSYQVRYVELNGRGGASPWSLRHTGVFHRLNAAESTDVVVLLHPVRKPLLEQMILSLKEDDGRRRQLCENPSLLHEILYGCYFDNWRWYMRYLGDKISDKNDLAMVTGPSHVEPNSSFDSVQDLRNTNDNVIFARACCAGNSDLLTLLAQSGAKLSQASCTLNVHQSKLRGYIESADVLERRTQNLMELVGYTLTLRNQLESAEVAKELRDVTQRLHQLTKSTVDDSATVKIITFVSAVYLPGSFIATLLGMNLFVFEDETSRLKISPDFWIFIVLWLPLTLMTGGVYAFIKSRSKSKKDMTIEPIREHKHDFSCSSAA